MKLLDILKEGKHKKEERVLKNISGAIKIDFSKALKSLESDDVLESMDHLENAIERIQDAHKMIRPLKLKYIMNKFGKK